MKYLIVLLLGALVGAALFGIGVVYNPLVGNQVISPLSVTDARTISLSYSAAPSDSLILTNDGLSRQAPYPDDVLQLWEKPIRQTEMRATVLDDARGQPAGIGVKMSSWSESTRVLNGEAIVDSVWYIYLPGRGSLFIEQRENYWDFFREVMLPAYRSSARAWRGNWLGNMTAGPGTLQTAKVSGGSGDFADADMIGLETMSVRAWSVDAGPVVAEGRLIVELPQSVDEEDL